MRWGMRGFAAKHGEWRFCTGVSERGLLPPALARRPRSIFSKMEAGGAACIWIHGNATTPFAQRGAGGG